MTRIAITAGATAGNKRRAATHYGVRDIENVLPSEHVTHEGHTVQHIVFNFDDLPVVGLDAAILRIPANSFMVSATLRVITPLAGTTPTVTIGLTEPDGTAIDPDGIDVAIAAAALSSVGETVLCDGALVGALVGIGAEDGQVVVTTGGTVTAGKFALEVVYSNLVDRAESQDV